MNFKTYSKPYKRKRHIVNDEEKRAIFCKVHKPIIKRAVYEKVKPMRSSRNKPTAIPPERSVLPVCLYARIAAQLKLPFRSTKYAHQVL